jgi:hypothetical protein
MSPDGERYDFCRIYVNTDDVDAVQKRLSKLFGVSFRNRFAVTVSVDVIVAANDDLLPDEDPDDFVNWPVRLEIGRQPAADVGAMRESVRRILTSFWDAQIGAVASSEFEDELPHDGGIHHPLTPQRQPRDDGGDKAAAPA